MAHDTFLRAVYAYAESISGLPDIFYPNVNQGTIPSEYLKINVMPVPTATIGVKTVKIRSGLIQITVVTKDNIGELRAATIAQLVMTAFARGTTLSDGTRISKEPYASAGFNDGKGHYHMPVTIQYESMC
jgi:hypothetical protein